MQFCWLLYFQEKYIRIKPFVCHIGITDYCVTHIMHMLITMCHYQHNEKVNAWKDCKNASEIIGNKKCK